MRFLALGDSYTVGESVAASERWPERLALALTAAGLATDPPEIVARTGWTTGELAAGIDAAAPRGPFGLVTLMIGVNDQYRDRPLAEYRTNFEALLARAVAFAGGRADHVIVLSIPDWGVTPFAAGRDRADIAGSIDAFNGAAHDAVSRAGTHWVDVTAISRRAAAEPALVAADGLHPSPALHAAWVERVLPEARAALAGP